MVKTVNESVRDFVQTNPRQVKRNGESYEQTRAFTLRVLKIAVTFYRKLNEVNMTARLLRDLMDFMLRRYHSYCIKEQFGAHYREVGISKKDCDFEHVLPAALARDLMIHNRISIEQAMNIPTCMLSKKNHKKLNSTKLSKTTPDIVNFWMRYNELNVKIETHKGESVNFDSWTLADHYNYFGIK
jgi:hypothetical protein